jgi:hypothetical protein
MTSKRQRIPGVAIIDRSKKKKKKKKKNAQLQTGAFQIHLGV